MNFSVSSLLTCGHKRKVSWKANKTNYYCCFICFPKNNPKATGLSENSIPDCPATYCFTAFGSSPVRERFCSGLDRKKTSLSEIFLEGGVLRTMNCSTMKLEISHVRDKLITERNMIAFFKSKWVEIGGWQFLIEEGKRSLRGTCCWKCTYSRLFFSTSVIRSLPT